MPNVSPEHREFMGDYELDLNPRTIDPKGWYGIYTHERLKQKRIVGPYPSEKEAYHDYGGDWDDIFIGAELVKKLNKSEYKAS